MLQADADILTRTEIERVVPFLPCAAYVCDEGGRITAFNEKAARLWGGELRTVDTSDGWMARALRDGRDCPGSPVVIEQPGGNRVDVVAHAKVLRDGDGRPAGALGIVVDVSAVRRDAQHKDEFLAMLGHDLRNPLGPIRNAMHILRAHTAEARALWAIGLVERQVDELVTVIDAASEISRMSRGLVKPVKAAFAIEDAINDAIAASAPMLSRRQQTCRAEIAADATPANGDRKRTEQAVRTMVRCVSRALPSGATVAVSAAAMRGRWTIIAGPASAESTEPPPATIAGIPVQQTPPASVGLMLLRALAGVLGAAIDVRPAGADAYSYELTLP